MKKLFLLTFAVLGMVAFVNGQTADDLLDPTTIGDGSNTLQFTVEGGAPGANLNISSTSGAGRTQLYVKPGGSDDRAFINVLSSSDIANSGFARLGARGSYAIVSAANTGSPSTRLSNVAIELDPNNTETGESFVIASGGFLVTGSPTILAKVDASGIETIEARVQASVTAPDYVFAADYDLRSLGEVEAYINKHSHLPEIPSAAEFEEDGIQLGKMSFDLLKKVEELTLYMIELKKENETLKARVTELENK